MPFRLGGIHPHQLLALQTQCHPSKCQAGTRVRSHDTFQKAICIPKQDLEQPHCFPKARCVIKSSLHSVTNGPEKLDMAWMLGVGGGEACHKAVIATRICEASNMGRLARISPVQTSKKLQDSAAALLQAQDRSGGNRGAKEMAFIPE